MKENLDPKTLVDYCVNPDLMHKCIFMQVYEEFLTFSYWLKGFQPNNILEITSTSFLNNLCALIAALM